LVLTHLLYLMSHYLLLCVCAHDTIVNTCFSTWIYQYTCICLCTPFGTHLTTRWTAFWLPWTCISRSRSLGHGKSPVDQSGSSV